LPYMSKRFLMKRYLGLTEEEIIENEQHWREERDQPELETTQGQDLRSIGITPAGMEADIETGQELSQSELAGAPGSQPTPSVSPGANSLGGSAGAAGAPSGGAPGVPGV